MDICNKCHKPGRIIKPGLRCLKCVTELKNEWKRKKKDRRCSYCKNPYVPNGIAKECSIKCKLLNRIKEVNGCWEWQGKITNVGYGEITHLKKYMLAHRCSYKTFVGEIPEGKVVCHTCDNKKCINPEHLWVGTQKENSIDKVNKKRNCKAYFVKYNIETLELVLDLRNQGKVYTEIAKITNIPFSTVAFICQHPSRLELIKYGGVT